MGADEGFFARLGRSVRRGALGMESDSDDDYDSDADAVRGRGSAWSRDVGEKEVDELEEMMADLSSAERQALSLAGARGPEGTETSTKGSAKIASNEEVAPTQAAMRKGTRKDKKKTGASATPAWEPNVPRPLLFKSEADDIEKASAGVLYVDVRLITILSGVFVRVTVASGNKMLAMDSGGTSDPYVQVSIVDSAGLPVKGQTHRTSYKPKTLDPIWDESFFMGSKDLKLRDCSLRFDVYDFDLMSSDDHMGHAVFPLSIFSSKVQVKKDLEEARRRQTEPFQHGYYTKIHPNKLAVCFKLENPQEESSHIMEEAKAMLSFARSLLDPRNIGKSLSKSPIGTWFNGKIEQAVDVGKRRALRVIDTTVEEKKLKICDLATKDRDMPKFIRHYLQGVISMYITDVQQELMSDLSVRLKILDAAKTATGGGERHVRHKKEKGALGCWNGVKGFFVGIRNWFLYNEIPCDMTIFGKLRNPTWWFFLITKLYYGLGFQAIMFTIRMLLVDKRDEWQMFEFIMTFKGIQFLTGTISTFTGVFGFIRCAGIIDSDQAHTCDAVGPWVDEMTSCVIGQTRCVQLNVASYGLRIILCWYAFQRLKYSFAYGRSIAGDHRLVGGHILITTVKSGSHFKSYGFLGKIFKLCGGRKKKMSPLDRFRHIVNVQLALNAKQQALRGGTELRRPGIGAFHYVRRKAKVKGYDVNTGLHTIYYRDDRTKTRRDIDLTSTTYTVLKLKHMAPRRLQRILLAYEIVTFLVAGACTIRFMGWIDWGEGQTWQIYGVAFWGQTLYNLLAFPFILMVIPGVNKVVCHAPKTGYTRDGRLKLFEKRFHFEKHVEDEPHPRSRVVPACYPFSNRFRV